MKSKEQPIEQRYTDLARKLGKLPSRREVKRLLGVYIDNFGAFKKQVLNANPGLEDLEAPVKLTDADIEAYRLSSYKNHAKSNNKEVVQKASFLNYLETFLEQTIKPVEPIKPFKSNEKTKRILNIIFSDVHIGADLKKEETGINSYSKVEESRRVAAVVKEVINYKLPYRKETDLEVQLLGDLFQGQLHDARDGAPLAEQIARTIHIFTQALQHLAANFKSVNVRCQSGNHSRNTVRHPKRAVNQKWDSYETVIYYALKTALMNQRNITFHIPKTPYGIYEVFGQNILYTHGDTFLNPGYPGTSINIKSLEGQINRLNASLKDRKEFQVVTVGHVHCASQTYLSNGSVMITNGALIEPDEYAVSIGIVETQTGQMMFESTPGYAVGDTRFIRAGRKEDQDESLDKIIAPFKSL